MGWMGSVGAVFRRSVVVSAAALLASLLSAATPTPAHADAGGMTCFRECLGQVGIAVTGDRDVIRTVMGYIQIVSPPFIDDPRLHLRVLDPNNNILYDEWHSWGAPVVGRSEYTWEAHLPPVGPGRVCSSGYEGRNLLATACIQIKV